MSVKEKTFDASSRIDNRGTVARGPWEFLTSGTVNNALGQHEALTLTYAGAFDTRELQYLALSTRQVLTGEGVTAFSDVSYSWGRPGTDMLELLEFQSKSFFADAGLSSPVIRSRDRNLTLSTLLFLSDDEGDILAAPNSEDRLRGIRFKADFDEADSLGGLVQINSVFSQGFVGLGSTENDNPLASRENGRVDFTKIEGTISRTQQLPNGFTAKFAATGQYAFTPLLASEECGYGGRDFGRAYDPSAITGDSCWSVSAELGFDLPVSPNPFFTKSQIYGFVDYGTVYRREPSAGTPTRDDGASLGAGLRLSWQKAFDLDRSAAVPIASGDDHTARFFLTANAHY
jgi:hemolysin activation/secretion protein